MKENETSDGKRSDRMSIGMFTDRESAESTFNSVHEVGYSNDDINPIMSDGRRKKHFSGDAEETAIGTEAAEGAAKGAIGTSLANIIS